MKFIIYKYLVIPTNNSLSFVVLYIIMDAYTIPAPGEGEDTTFTLEVWEEHGTPPILILAEGWTEIEDQAFTDRPDLEMIRIPASVVSIQQDAFNGAIELRQVEFAQGSRLEFIGARAFGRTEALERINIPASVTMIDDDAFSNASSLVEVTFEEGSQLESIGNGAFSDATALERIRIPSSVADIGQGAFLNATSLQTIRIPRLVDTIMFSTFENATSLREVTFEEDSQLEFINDGAFRGAIALQTIQIPASVLSISEDAFANTANLRELSFERNSEITSIHPTAFIGSGLTLVVMGEIVLEGLNDRRMTLNLPPLRFGQNDNFYGAGNVNIVSRAQQISSLMFSMRNTPTRPRISDDITRRVGTFLMPPGVVPKSRKALEARGAAMEEESEGEESAGGARKSRRRKRGIRRSGRKASRARKTKKRKSKRRRTQKRK